MSEKEFAKQRSAARRKRNRTITTTKNAWFHLGHDGSLHIVNQRFGEPSTGNVRLTRAEFEQFVSFYKRGHGIT
jgi:hypothetical protein